MLNETEKLTILAYPYIVYEQIDLNDLNLLVEIDSIIF
jgi:hypothetical protein